MAYKDLNEDEASWYIKTYSDVTWSDKLKMSTTQYANKHYLEWGLYEGRNRGMYTRMTVI